ncbi:TonB-dependent siderophore receptor [uncultured Psychromonas sp.]|uniref:TonB-dependent siderophore receptor n=1 Tax=uncultured Psychromonas sp. TaxID=173974 RepID=UPI002613DE37|nr:TonB-dependent siderophore receptor [uncultured Psychromonas sp.]
MFNRSQLSILIGATLASSVIYVSAAENTGIEADPEKLMVVTGERANYKADSNTGSMRMEMTQLETPGQVTVIDEQIIDEQRATKLSDVLKNDSSVSALGDSRNRERFSLRGFELSSSTGFLRDGKQHWSHYRQPVELLQSVEVLKGPAGLLYGQSAPGGLINMVSKKPTAETHVVFSQDLGSNNSTRSTLDISGALNKEKTLRSRLVLSQQNYDSWRSYSDGSSPSTDRFVGGLFVDYDLNDAVTLSAHYDRTTDNGGVDSGAYVVAGKSVLGDEYIWDTQWSNIDNEVENVGFGVDAQLNDNWSLNVSYNHQDFKRHDVESYPVETSYDGTTYTQAGSDRSDNWIFQTASADLVGEFDTGSIGHKVLIGSNWLGYSYEREQYSLVGSTTTVGEPNSSATIDTDASVKTTDTTYNSYGFYVQDMMTFNDQWQALAGLRYDLKVTPGDDGESDERLDAIVPKVALIYHPTSDGSIYLTYSESFEPQSDVSDSNATNDGASLDPVNGKLYELGTKWELLDKQLFASGAIFQITEENSTINVGTADSYEVTQTGERVHRGVEFAFQGNITDDLSLSGTGTYLDAEYTTDANYQGNRPADVPKYAASLWSRYQVTHNTDLNLGATYVGSRYGDAANTFKKDGYTRFDLGLAHHFQYDQNLEMVFRVNVENLLDTDYYAGGGSTGDDYASNGAQNVVVGEGRNFMATVQVRY